MDTHQEKLLCAELTMLIGNATTRLRRFQTDGYTVSFSEFAARACDDDPRLARRVLLRAGWVPSDGGDWIIAKGIHPLEKALAWDILEATAESILDDYRPIDEPARAA